MGHDLHRDQGTVREAMIRQQVEREEMEMIEEDVSFIVVASIFRSDIWVEKRAVKCFFQRCQ